MHYLSYAAEVIHPPPSGDHDLVVGLVVALIVMVLVIRYLKAILFLIACVLLAVLFVGVLEIEPLIVQLITNVQSTRDT